MYISQQAVTKLNNWTIRRRDKESKDQWQNKKIC